MKDKVLKRAEELVSMLGLHDKEYDVIKKNLSEEPVISVPDIFYVKNAIDHTCLSFNASEKDIFNLCREADRYKFKAVCINPVWIKTAFEERKKLNGDFLIATVIDFPLGASTETARKGETDQALTDGADELDLVMSTGLLKSGKLKECYRSIKCVAEKGGYLKVILETSELEVSEKIDAALLSVFAGAQMLKTSTGFLGKATIEDVKLLRMIAGRDIGVKAAGGIRDKKSVLEMIGAGADRIGCSSSVSIVESW